MTTIPTHVREAVFAAVGPLPLEENTREAHFAWLDDAADFCMLTAVLKTMHAKQLAESDPFASALLTAEARDFLAEHDRITGKRR